MNKRIKELALQAEISRLEYNTATMMTTRIQEFDKEKFAELIVRECLDIIRKEVSIKYQNGGETDDFMGGHYASSILSRVKIKHHFEIKE